MVDAHEDDRIEPAREPSADSAATAGAEAAPAPAEAEPSAQAESLGPADEPSTAPAETDSAAIASAADAAIGEAPAGERNVGAEPVGEGSVAVSGPVATAGDGLGDSSPEGAPPDAVEAVAAHGAAETSPGLGSQIPPEGEVLQAETGDSASRSVAVEPKAEPPAEAPVEPPPKSENMQWYILKVQSNREESIKEGLLRRVKRAGLDHFFGEVIIPTEKVTEFRGGKKKVVKRKLYPGYLVVQMELNDDTWFLVRETAGIGDFTGAAGRPAPMLPHEVERILMKEEERHEKAPTLKIAFKPGDQVKINEGTFENFEGEVASIDETNGRVTVMINIFGRSTPVELEYWQIGAV